MKLFILSLLMSTTVFAKGPYYCVNDDLHDLATGEFVRKIDKSDGDGCAAAVATSKDGLYCSGHYEGTTNGSLRDLATGKEIRFIYELPYGGCRPALQASQGGYYCHGYYIVDIRTGKPYRSVSKKYDGIECWDLLKKVSH